MRIFVEQAAICGIAPHARGHGAGVRRRHTAAEYDVPVATGASPGSSRALAAIYRSHEKITTLPQFTGVCVSLARGRQAKN